MFKSISDCKHANAKHYLWWSCAESAFWYTLLFPMLAQFVVPWFPCGFGRCLITTVLVQGILGFVLEPRFYRAAFGWVWARQAQNKGWSRRAVQFRLGFKKWYLASLRRRMRGLGQTHLTTLCVLNFLGAIFGLWMAQSRPWFSYNPEYSLLQPIFGIAGLLKLVGLFHLLDLRSRRAGGGGGEDAACGCEAERAGELVGGCGCAGRLMTTPPCYRPSSRLMAVGAFAALLTVGCWFVALFSDWHSTAVRVALAVIGGFSLTMALYCKRYTLWLKPLQEYVDLMNATQSEPVAATDADRTMPPFQSQAARDEPEPVGSPSNTRTAAQALSCSEFNPELSSPDDGGDHKSDP